MAAFRGMHVSPANHSSAWLPRKMTTGQTDGQMPDKVIPMCRYASQVTQKLAVVLFVNINTSYIFTHAFIHSILTFYHIHKFYITQMYTFQSLYIKLSCHSLKLLQMIKWCSELEHSLNNAVFTKNCKNIYEWYFPSLYLISIDNSHKLNPQLSSIPLHKCLSTKGWWVCLFHKQRTLHHGSASVN